MKLVIAIVQDEDAPALTDALVAAGHRSPRSARPARFSAPETPACSSASQTTGIERDRILRRTCRRRTQVAVPYSPALSRVCSICPRNSRSRSVERSFSLSTLLASNASD